MLLSLLSLSLTPTTALQSHFKTTDRVTRTCEHIYEFHKYYRSLLDNYRIKTEKNICYETSRKEMLKHFYETTNQDYKSFVSHLERSINANDGILTWLKQETDTDLSLFSYYNGGQMIMPLSEYNNMVIRLASLYNRITGLEGIRIRLSIYEMFKRTNKKVLDETRRSLEKYEDNEIELAKKSLEIFEREADGIIIGNINFMECIRAYEKLYADSGSFVNEYGSVKRENIKHLYGLFEKYFYEVDIYTKYFEKMARLTSKVCIELLENSLDNIEVQLKKLAHEYDYWPKTSGLLKCCFEQLYMEVFCFLNKRDTGVVFDTSLKDCYNLDLKGLEEKKELINLDFLASRGVYWFKKSDKTQTHKENSGDCSDNSPSSQKGNNLLDLFKKF